MRPSWLDGYVLFGQLAKLRPIEASTTRALEATRATVFESPKRMGMNFRFWFRATCEWWWDFVSYLTSKEIVMDAFKISRIIDNQSVIFLEKRRELPEITLTSLLPKIGSPKP